MIQRMTQRTERTALSMDVAGELRAHIARRGLTGRSAAKLIDVEQGWLLRRLHDQVPISLDDLELICKGLGIEVSEIIR